MYIPDATKSVFKNVAILEIHMGSPFNSSLPCASGIVHKGDFLTQAQTHNSPSSPQLKKFSSFISLTASILPPWPLKINCDSSTIFHILMDLSNPPLVIARSLVSASIDVILF